MAALPIAMIGATLLGLGAGIASLHSGESERDGIQLLSGQYVRIQSRVRLSEEGKKRRPDSCLVASEDGTVTKVDIAGRKATVRCNKNRRAAPEEIPAEDLEVIDSGINAPGISIPGGYLTEGASVRMLDSSKRTNKGKALASPFYNPVGTVMVIDKVQKQVVVLSNHLNNKSTAQEYYNIDDLEFVSGPSADARKGAEAGLALKIGSTVELTDEAKKKYAPGVVNTTFNKPLEKKLADPKWEKFGIVKSITLDPKDNKKKIVIVRCVSKDSKKEVLEQKYDFTDLKAIPAISVERAGIAVFGGMAEMDTKVKLRSERKSAVASKSLGRSAFGDVGTVSDLEPNDPNNLKVFVTCNGINPDEQTGDWYQPEDLELAEPEDTEGEAVFGGRVVVGSTVRVMQSARGKKCLGTPEFGDVGTVKGIDPSAADNLKINVTCGRSDAKQSEWYDPRDLSLYFPVDESGSELEKAKVALADAQKELSAWQLQPQTYRRSEDGRKDRNTLEGKVAAAQAEVDRLSGQGLDKTKANEMRNDSEEKLDEAMKLKRELEAVRLKLSRDSTCKKPDRSTKYKENTDKVLLKWLNDMTVDKSDYSEIGLEPLQYSNSYRVALTEVQTAFRSFEAQAKDDATFKAYSDLNLAKLVLRKALKKDRSDTESFSNLDDKLLDIAKEQAIFDKIEPNPYKSALKTVDEKLKKLQEVTTQIQSAAYSGDSPAEKLLKRVEELEKKTSDDINGNDTDLQKATREYNNAFAGEQANKHILERVKYDYDQKFLAATGKGKTGQPKPTEVELGKLFDKVEDARREYIKSQTDTLKKRKAQALLSAKTTCSEITLESINDMKEKIQKIINGKCGVLTTIDDLLDKVDDLISKRKRAFTMSQAVLDPKFGDPGNAIFDIPITSPEDRIAEIQTAMAEVEKEPTLGKLKDLTDLCGRYNNDGGLLNAAIKIKLRDAPKNTCGPYTLSPPVAPKVPRPDNTVPPSPAPEPAPATSRTRRTGSQVLDDLAEKARIRNEKVQEDNRKAHIEDAKLKAEAERRRQEAEAAKAELALAPAPEPECPFKVGDIVHVTDPMFNPNDRYVIVTVTDCNSVQVVNEGQSESTQKPMEFSIQRIQAVVPPTAGKRKWPFYGRRTTRRSQRGAGEAEVNALKSADRELSERLKEMNANPGNRLLIEAVRKATEDANRARAASERAANIENNPFATPTDPATTYVRNPAGQTQQIMDAQIREDNRRANEAYNGSIATRNPLQLDTDLPPPLPPAQPEFDRAENKRQFDEAIRATEEKVRVQLEQNQREYERQLAEKQRVQDEVIAELRMIAEKGAFDARQEATRKELQRKEAEIEKQKKQLLQEVLDKNKGVRYRAEEELQRKVGNFKAKYDNESAQKRINKLFDTIETNNKEIDKENTREAEKKEAERRKEKEEDEARIKRVKEEREAFLKTKEQKDLEAELLAQGGPELLAAWKKDQKAKAKDAKMMEGIKARNALISLRNAENAKLWEDYDKQYSNYTNDTREYDSCMTKYRNDLAKYNEDKNKHIHMIAKDLGDDQILRLQSRGVGSSLMLDEARKLMIDADAQQRTVMDLKTDLQFTLASSSDADIAKAVGFYEAELQKLKTCISKGKEDAIAEYEKDLAEIEKRKREITTKTFEVKVPQDNQQPQGNTDYLKNMTKTQLTSEIAKLKAEKAGIKPNPGQTTLSGKQNKRIANLDVKIKFANQRFNDPSTSAGGNRRMTMRRRRV